MTPPIRQSVPLPVSAERDNGRRMAAGRDQDHTGAAAGVLTAKPRQAQYYPRSRAAAMPDDVAVVRIRGDLGASVLHAYLSDIWWHGRAGSVAGLAELGFIDCACLGVLVRHGKQTRRQGGTFALASPQPAARRVLAATGLLTWFEVHDSRTTARSGTISRTSPVNHKDPCWPVRR
jgi:anti-anti-sigma factor